MSQKKSQLARDQLFFPPNIFDPRRACYDMSLWLWRG